MSRCVTDDELQAVVDNEAPAEHREHVAHCPACGDRAAARRTMTTRVVNAAASVDMDGVQRAHMWARVVGVPAAGATTLRALRKRPTWVWALPLAAAAALLVFFVLVPGIDRQTTVSAAEVLGRSQAALSVPLTGVEDLSYDLEIGGALGELLPGEQAGRFTVSELIDHGHEGRYRILKLAPDGRLVAGAADDPVGGTRTRYIRVNGRGFLLRFNGAAPAALSMVALKRSALQIFIGLMQASGAQSLRELDRAGERCYEITIPRVTVAATSVVSLDRAQAVITADDSRLVAFSTAGTFSGQPFTIEFALRSRELSSTTTSGFELEPEPGDVVLEGDASTNPVWDVLARLLDAIPAR